MGSAFLFMEKPSFRIAKVDDDEQLIFGWASVALAVDGSEIIDAQEHVIDPDDLERAVYLFNLISRELDEKHTEAVQGILVESLVVTPEKLGAMKLAKDALPQGWWVGFWVPDPVVFAKVKTGEYAMFSIAGTARLEDI